MDYQVFDALLDSVVVVDRNLKLIYCNEAVANLTGLSVRRLKPGYPLGKFLTFDNNYLSDPKTLESILDPTPYQEIQFASSAGNMCLVQLTIERSNLAPKDDPHWIIIMRDMTLEEVLQAKYRSELVDKEKAFKDLESADKKLRDYSMNLEGIVRKRTRALHRTNQTLKAILDSLGQGLLVFDREGFCLPAYSKACEDLFEAVPPFIWVADLLKLDRKEREVFDKWIEHMFNESLPFESLVELGPKMYKHSAGLHIELNFHPVRDDDRNIRGIVLVGTDKTEELLAKREARHEREYVKMVVKMIKNRRQFGTFLNDARSNIEILESGTKNLRSRLKNSKNHSLDYSQKIFEPFLRSVHTMKGGSATFSISDLRDVCHEAENWVFEKQDEKELITEKDVNQLQEYVEKICRSLDNFLQQNVDIIGKAEMHTVRVVETPVDKGWELADRLSKINDSDERLNYIVKELLCEPILNSLTHFDNVVLTYAEKLSKLVSPIVFVGCEIKIWPENFSGLFSTLMHAFRNAIDHGIEPPDEREICEKTPAGLIRVVCKDMIVGGVQWINIQIIDDGRGVNPESIRSKAQKRGLVIPDNATDEDIIQNVFNSQFTTKEVVTELSGRGVGLDAIKIEAESLGGWVKVSSVLGKNTTIEIAVPNIIEVREIEKSLKKAA